MLLAAGSVRVFSPQATHFAEEVDGILLSMLHCRGFTILHEAARHGHNDLAQLLLQKAASVNATTHTGLCLNEVIRVIVHDAGNIRTVLGFERPRLSQA